VLFLFISFIKVGINVDESLPYRFFLIFPALTPPKEGDLVAVKLADKLVVKRVGCAFPARLEVKNSRFFCLSTTYGRKFLGEALLPSRYTYAGQIPKGCYFLVGEHPRSYDSRYWGLFCNVRLKAVGLGRQDPPPKGLRQTVP